MSDLLIFTLSLAGGVFLLGLSLGIFVGILASIPVGSRVVQNQKEQS